MFRNILVCVDGSPEAEQALVRAISMADCDRSRLTIVTAVCRPPCWANTPATAAGIEPLAAELAEEARRTLCRAVDRVPQCVPVTKILTEEPIRDALDRLLAEDRHDLLVLGAGTRGRLLRRLHRSLSRHAARHTDIPILNVRAEGEGEPEARRPQEPAAAAVVA